MESTLNKTNGGIFTPYRFEVCDKGAYLNGVIYWLGKQHEYSVYTLDVETEKIKLSVVLEVGHFSNHA